MDQIQYQSFEQSEEYRPYQVPNMIPAIEREQARQRQADQAYAQGLAANNKTRMINAGKTGEDLEALATFSKTLTDFLVVEQEQRNKDEELEGIMLAYNEGISPEQQQAFQESEDALRTTGAETDAVAQTIEEQTGDLVAGEQVRQMSGWRQYGYARGRAQMMAMSFPAYMEAATQNTEIVIDGRTVTFQNAQTSAEFAALQQQVISTFMSNFAGVNPALLNEYVFPQVSRTAAQQAAAWSAERSEQIKRDRLEERTNTLLTDFEVDPAAAASNYILNHPEGPKAGNRELASVLEDGIRNGSIDPRVALELLNTEITFNDGQVTTLAQRNPSLFGGLVNLADDAIEADITRSNRERTRGQRQFVADTVQQVQEMAAEGQYLTTEEMRAIEERWYELSGSRVLPNELANLITAESREDIDDERRLAAIVESQGYLRPQDIQGVSQQVLNQFQGAIQAGNSVTSISSDQEGEAKQHVTAVLDAAYQISDPDAVRSPQYRRAQRELMRNYQRFYAEGITKGYSEGDAHEYALGQIDKFAASAVQDPNGFFQTYAPSLNEDQTALLESSRQSVIDNADENGNLPQDFVIPNTEAEIEDAYNYVTRGEGSIPELYVQLARGQSYTSYDLARQQLVAAGRIPPDGTTSAERTGIGPDIRDLLLRHPSDSRTTRSVVQSEDKAFFLDAVASYESESYGGYDAMNTGGTGWGTSNTAYGSANSADVFDRPLSQMTLGEVMDLQRQGRVFAAGRYQFIPETLEQTAREMGLDPDTPFNAETQDALAIGRLRWRLSVDNSLNGLRTEWQGLFHMPDEEAQRLLATARQIAADRQMKINFDSPYNQPQNTLPGLLG